MLRKKTAAGKWKSVNVRRRLMYIERRLKRDTRWAVFEPNGEALWEKLRQRAGAFMQDLFRKGVLAGRTPEEAFFVKCDGETTTRMDIENGIVNVEVGFAPLKPAEFVVIRISQRTGQGPG